MLLYRSRMSERNTGQGKGQDVLWVSLRKAQMCLTVVRYRTRIHTCTTPVSILICIHRTELRKTSCIVLSLPSFFNACDACSCISIYLYRNTFFSAGRFSFRLLRQHIFHATMHFITLLTASNATIIFCSGREDNLTTKHRIFGIKNWLFKNLKLYRF